MEEVYSKYTELKTGFTACQWQKSMTNILIMCHSYSCILSEWHIRQVEQKPGGRGSGREWATLGVHPLSWLLSNNRLEKLPFVSVPHTSSNWLLLSNQDKGCTPSVAHSLALPLGPALLNLWTIDKFALQHKRHVVFSPSAIHSSNV